jgi:hypothetical protein
VRDYNGTIVLIRREIYVEAYNAIKKSGNFVEDYDPIWRSRTIESLDDTIHVWHTTQECYKDIIVYDGNWYTLGTKISGEKVQTILHKAGLV